MKTFNRISEKLNLYNTNLKERLTRLVIFFKKSTSDVYKMDVQYDIVDMICKLPVFFKELGISVRKLVENC